MGILGFPGANLEAGAYWPPLSDVPLRSMRGESWFEGTRTDTDSAGLDVLPGSEGYFAFLHGGRTVFWVDSALPSNEDFPLDARARPGPQTYRFT